jgi:lysophospholipase L1-like esterase
MSRRILLPALLLSSAALLGAAGFVAPTRPAMPPGPGTPPAVVEAADKPAPRPGGWMNRHNTYVEKAKKGGIDLYMLGDSITDFWGNNPRFLPNWTKNLGGWNPGDFGISGDRTEHVLYRIENGELDGVHPKAIVLMIGTNNLPPAAGNTPAQVADGVKAILGVLQQKQPQAKILLLAIFPRADARAGADIMEKINATNDLISKFDDGKQVKFLNINKVFLDADGKLTREIFADLLHPTEKGYQLWADAIRPTLTQWLGEPAASPATQPH